MDEFQLIQRYFASLTPSTADVHIGIGDDAALLAVAVGQELAVTTDTLVAGRHYPVDTAPYDVGWKSLAVNLSDLAAMGARPRWFTLALTLELADEAWVAEFARGLRDLAARHAVALVGGDTTRGPQSITITAMGEVPHAQALRRTGARPGDVVCVTGTLGDAALALALEPGRAPASLRERLDRPQPRVTAGLRLRGLATAAIDLSDGLAGDLGHVLRVSGGGARIDAALLPASPDFLGNLRPGDSRLALQAQGGDDYELCICLPLAALEGARASLDVPLTAIGRITAEPGLRFVDASGATITVPPHGYRHFE